MARLFPWNLTRHQNHFLAKTILQRALQKNSSTDQQIDENV
jgi:hypothetical protein